jgi:hypothetical protein
VTATRSLSVGDHGHYASPYLEGVARACRRLGVAHRQVGIRRAAAEIRRALDEHRPHVVWTHMLLWPPPGAPPVEDLIDLMERAARAGARVAVHDGDYKERARHPRDISSWCSVALVNHAFDRSAWKTPILRWPYAAMPQARIADPRSELACELFFAGRTGTDPTYAARTRLLDAVRARGVRVRTPGPADGNTLLRTPEVAASADAVLGFGRPGADGWVDTRVFQYPGAGGVLVHDDAAGYLEPWTHFVPYASGSADGVAEALSRLRRTPPGEVRALRERAFAHVQANHSSVARVRAALAAVGLKPPAGG